jgi:citrate lyase subunit beta/citryl-CoA lyase
MIFQDITQLPQHYGSARKAPCSHRRHRSNMMLNPLELKHLNRIDDLDADVITLNLEDAIAFERKKEALHNIALFLSHLKHSRSCIVVRVNPLDEGGEEEIRFLNDFAFDAVRVAKVRDETQIARALTLLSEDKELHVSLETKEAFERLASLRIDPRFTTVNLGILDLLTSLGLPQSLVRLDNPTIEYLLAEFLVKSHTAGLHPVGFMFQAYNDTETFRKWCEKEKMMGFTSKACMGPKQVAIANSVFGIDAEEMTRAKYIVERFEEESAKGNNGFIDARYGIFIDEPIYRDALLTLKSVT